MPQTIKFEGRSYTFPDDATDAEISEALDSMQGPASAQTPTFGPLGVVGADAARRGAVYTAEQIATAPATRTAVRAATSAPVRAAIGAAAGGWPGAVIGQAAKLPATMVESGVRSGAGMVARAAGSTLATALTSPLATVATMPFTEAGDRPVGETPAITAARQRQFEADHAKQMRDKAQRKQAGQMTTADYIEAAIEQILGRGKQK